MTKLVRYAFKATANNKSALELGSSGGRRHSRGGQPMRTLLRPEISNFVVVTRQTCASRSSFAHGAVVHRIHCGSAAGSLRHQAGLGRGRNFIATSVHLDRTRALSPRSGPGSSNSVCSGGTRASCSFAAAPRPGGVRVSRIGSLSFAPRSIMSSQRKISAGKAAPSQPPLNPSTVSVEDHSIETLDKVSDRNAQGFGNLGRRAADRDAFLGLSEWDPVAYGENCD